MVSCVGAVGGFAWRLILCISFIIRRHDHIRDASIIDQIGDALRPDDGPSDIEVECESLVRAHILPPPDLPLAPSSSSMSEARQSDSEAEAGTEDEY